MTGSRLELGLRIGGLGLWAWPELFASKGWCPDYLIQAWVFLFGGMSFNSSLEWDVTLPHGRRKAFSSEI